MARICVVATGHLYDDERIYHKQVKTLVEANHSITYISRAKNIQENFPNLLHYSLGSSLSPFRRILGIHREIIKQIRNGEFDYVIIHDPELVLTALFLKKKRQRLIYDIHDDYEQTILSRKRIPSLLRKLFASLWLSIEKYVVNRCYAVMFADGTTRSKFGKEGSIVLGSYPTLDFVVTNDQVVKNDIFTLIYVGGVSKERGILTAVEALKMIPEVNLEFHVFGSAQNEDIKRAMASDKRIKFFGKVEWKELIHRLAGSHLGLALYQPLPSFYYSPGDNAGKMLEYMAGGLPFLISDFPGIRRFCTENNVGILIDPENPKEIADAIFEVYSSNKHWQKQGKKYKDLIISKFSWEAVSLEFLKLFK